METNPANGIKDLMWKFLMDKGQKENIPELKASVYSCLLYTSDAADEEDSVDLGGSRVLKKKKREEGEVRGANEKKETKKGNNIENK